MSLSYFNFRSFMQFKSMMEMLKINFYLFFRLNFKHRYYSYPVIFLIYNSNRYYAVKKIVLKNIIFLILYIPIPISLDARVKNSLKNLLKCCISCQNLRTICVEIFECWKRSQTNSTFV